MYSTILTRIKYYIENKRSHQEETCHCKLRIEKVTKKSDQMVNKY